MTMENRRGKGEGEGEGWRKSCTGRGCTDGVQSESDSDVIVGAAFLSPTNLNTTVACPPY
jgi:hypothetical protein